MTDPLAFFHTDPVRRVLDRASRAGAMSVSVHYIEHGEEGPAIAGAGQCDACRYVARVSGGISACRKSRLPASVSALIRGKPTPFVCHMGFACVVARALPPDREGEAGRDKATGFTLTVGPYCPAEAPQTLEADAVAGLGRLEITDPAFLPTLADVRIVPADAGPALAEWVVDALAREWELYGKSLRDESEDSPPPEPSDPPLAAPKARSRAKGPAHARPAGGPAPASAIAAAGAIAAALQGGDQTQARRLVCAALSETSSPTRTRLAVRRARSVAIVSAVLEAAERAGMPTAPCWDRYDALLARTRQARTDADLANAAMDLLRVLRPTRKAKTPNPKPQTPNPNLAWLETLNSLVSSKLADGITLAAVARAVGKGPTAISHHLQRKFGLSFSRYVARLRLDRAKELLRRTKLSVADIARRVGIRDASNLGKLIREFEGMSPLEYRQRFGRRP